MADSEQMAFFAPAEPAAPRKSKPDAKASASKAAEPAVYDQDRVVAYAGHQHVITDRTLSLEAIRQMLERDYPELSKDRCEMTYDAKTGIFVPVVKGARKGATR